MKCDIIPKQILDTALLSILECIGAVATDNPEVARELQKAYTMIQNSRSGCNVQPEQP